MSEGGLPSWFNLRSEFNYLYDKYGEEIALNKMRKKISMFSHIRYFDEWIKHIINDSEDNYNLWKKYKAKNLRDELVNFVIKYKGKRVHV